MVGKTKGKYSAEFPEGSRVRIAEVLQLEEFRREWKYHHPIQIEQLQFAGAEAEVLKVMFYHGGDELNELSDIPGIWHEICLRPVSE